MRKFSQTSKQTNKQTKKTLNPKLTYSDFKAVNEVHAVLLGYTGLGQS